ncbi:MAG: hypothetical protein ABJB12_24625, partial [Pseudomonadota bacterium]
MRSNERHQAFVHRWPHGAPAGRPTRRRSGNDIAQPFGFVRLRLGDGLGHLDAQFEMLFLGRVDD